MKIKLIKKPNSALALSCILVILLYGCSRREDWFDSTSLSSDGSRVYVIHHSTDESNLLMINLNSESSSPIKIAAGENPIEVTAGIGSSFAIVNRKKLQKKDGNKRGLYILSKYSDAINPKIDEIARSDIFIGSVIETESEKYAFQLGTDILPSGRSISKFVERGPKTPLRYLSEKNYGYKFGISLVNENLIFLTGEKNLAGKSKLEIIKLKTNAVVPFFLDEHFSRNSTQFGCSRSNDVCFSITPYSPSGVHNSSHRLLFTKENITCDLKIPFYWIEFPSISSDGRRFAFITPDDAKVSPVGVGTRKLIVVDLYINSCGYTYKQFQLKGK